MNVRNSALTWLVCLLLLWWAFSGGPFILGLLAALVLGGWIAVWALATYARSRKWRG